MKPIVSKHYYHDVFVNEFNLQFGYPHSDTWDTCDSLSLKIAAANNELKATELQIHLERAEAGYASLKKGHCSF